MSGRRYAANRRFAPLWIRIGLDLLALFGAATLFWLSLQLAHPVLNILWPPAVDNPRAPQEPADAPHISQPDGRR